MANNVTQAVVEALERRRSIYQQKAEQAADLAGNTDTPHDRYAFAAEAMDWAINDASIAAEQAAAERERALVEAVALSGEKVAVAAQAFCSELQEDSEGVPKLELAKLHDALNEWEGIGAREGPHDDSTPESSVLADLEMLERDPHATDLQRRIAARAIVILTALRTDREAVLEEKRVLVEALTLALEANSRGDLKRNADHIRQALSTRLTKEPQQ